MTNVESLYGELKGELETLTNPLFDFACQQVTKRGAFLPVGARLAADGEVALVAAKPDEDVTSVEVVRPLLIAALRQSPRDSEAVAYCEWVKIDVDGSGLNDAIKVHAHHKQGLAVTFYLPATKSFWQGWKFGNMIVKSTEGVIDGWPCADA
jgi:hypothetical protein